MRERLLAVSVVCALSVSAGVRAADNVYVDLSVLDAAPRDSIGFVASQPLFPVYEKPEVKPVRRVKLRKKTQVPVVLPAVKPEQKIEEPAVHNDKNAKTETVNTEIRTIETEKTTIEQLPEKETAKGFSSPEESAASAPVTSETAQQTSETATEQLSPRNDETPVSAESGAEEVSSEKSETENLPVVPEEEAEVKKTAEKSETATETAASAPVVMSATTAELREASAINNPREVYSLLFAPESSELSSEALLRLEEAARTFDAEQKKKISVKAYNFDNGEDSFRKKRISLMRATEVRSWFLNRGFKNFSIRVVNSSTDEENKDIVEIEELD